MIIKRRNLEAKKSRIQELIDKNYITNTDIKELIGKSYSEICNDYRSPIETKRHLYRIYVQPYLLCKDYPTKIDIDLIAQLMIKRYAMELSEANYLYNDGALNLNEYYEYMDKLVTLYFKTSLVGKFIYQKYGDNFELSDLFCDTNIKKKNKHI